MDSMDLFLDHQLLIKLPKHLESQKDHIYDNNTHSSNPVNIKEWINLFFFILFELTLALNIYWSRSIEYNPGLSVRFCWYPSVIIGVPNWIRFTIIPDGITVTYADNDDVKSDETIIVTVNVNSYLPIGNVRGGIYNSLNVVDIDGSNWIWDEQFEVQFLIVHFVLMASELLHLRWIFELI